MHISSGQYEADLKDSFKNEKYSSLRLIEFAHSLLNSCEYPNLKSSSGFRNFIFVSITSLSLGRFSIRSCLQMSWGIVVMKKDVLWAKLERFSDECFIHLSLGGVASRSFSCHIFLYGPFPMVFSQPF